MAPLPTMGANNACLLLAERAHAATKYMSTQLAKQLKAACCGPAGVGPFTMFSCGGHWERSQRVLPISNESGFSKV